MSRDTLTGCLERRLEPDEIHQPIVDRCCICKEDIFAGEIYFDFDGEMVHEDCVHEYIRRYRVNG